MVVAVRRLLPPSLLVFWLLLHVVSKCCYCYLLLSCHYKYLIIFASRIMNMARHSAFSWIELMLNKTTEIKATCILRKCSAQLTTIELLLPPPSANFTGQAPPFRRAFRPGFNGGMEPWRSDSLTHVFRDPQTSYKSERIHYCNHINHWSIIYN